MELKYILYSKVHKETDAGSIWTYKYQPTLEEYKKDCCFSVTTPYPIRTLKELNLPEGIGDIIVMEFKPKNVQDKLPKTPQKKDA